MDVPGLVHEVDSSEPGRKTVLLGDTKDTFPSDTLSLIIRADRHSLLFFISRSPPPLITLISQMGFNLIANRKRACGGGGVSASGNRFRFTTEALGKQVEADVCSRENKKDSSQLSRNDGTGWSDRQKSGTRKRVSTENTEHPGPAPEAVAPPTAPTAAFTLMEGAAAVEVEEGRLEPQAPQEHRFDPGRGRREGRETSSVIGHQPALKRRIHSSQTPHLNAFSSRPEAPKSTWKLQQDAASLRIWNPGCVSSPAVDSSSRLPSLPVTFHPQT